MINPFFEISGYKFDNSADMYPPEQHNANATEIQKIKPHMTTEPPFRQEILLSCAVLVTLHFDGDQTLLRVNGKNMWRRRK